MKTIIYILIAVFAFGIISNGLINKASAETRILIQPTDSNISSASISQSAKIISARLKDFSSEKFEVTVIPGKNQIQVTLDDNQDLKLIEDLLVQHGSIAFYATYNHERLSELLKGDNQLFSLLKSNDPDHSIATVGCTAGTEVEKVNDYLKTVTLRQKCKFAWSQSSGDNNVCLYALCLEGGKGALLTGSDIDTVKFNQDKISGIYELGIEFKKPAVKLWADATKRNINNAIAIVLDNKVIYAPVLKSVIEGGKCSITGDFTKSQVQYLAALCNNGELPVSFKVVK
jgi:SecD/SecF fusion protein